MAKLHIVCPNCSTKYPVADDKLAGRRVTCKKCSQKFVAEIQGAAPPPEEELSLVSSSAADDPFGSDLFGDFPTSEAAATSAPALGALPAKQKNSSVGSFAVVPMLLGSVRVAGVSVVVIIAFSSVFASPGTGQGSSPGNNVSGGPRGPGAPWNDRGFGPPPNQGGGRNEGAFAPPRNQGGANDEGIYVPPADGGNSRPPERPTFGGSNPEPYDPASDRSFGRPGEGARRAAEEEYRRAMDNQHAMGANPPEDKFLLDMQKRYGEQNIVRLESKEMSQDEAVKLRDSLVPLMMGKSSRVTYDLVDRVRYIQFPYKGGVQAFAPKVTFGVVESINVEKGRIRLKTYTIPQ